MLSPSLLAGGSSILDYAEMCFLEYLVLKDKPGRESQALQNLFTAAHHKHSDAANELMMNYEQLTLTLKLSKTRYQDFIQELINTGNAFAAYFAYQEELPVKTSIDLLIHMMEINDNPAYLTSKAVGHTDDVLRLLDRAMAQGFYLAARKKAQVLYWRSVMRKVQGTFLSLSHDKELAESVAINRLLAENDDDVALYYLVEALEKAPELQEYPCEFQRWCRKLLLNKRRIAYKSRTINEMIFLSLR